MSAHDAVDGSSTPHASATDVGAVRLPPSGRKGRGAPNKKQPPLGGGGAFRRGLLLLRLVTSVANSTAAAGYRSFWLEPCEGASRFWLKCSFGTCLAVASWPNEVRYGPTNQRHNGVPTAGSLE